MELSIDQSESISTTRKNGAAENDPTFLIIGAQKSATTWLYQMLRQHPDVHIPETKEVNFFNKEYNYSKGISWYRDELSGGGKVKAIGDATPNYLWTSSTEYDLKQSHRNRDIPALVHKHYPDIKLIVSFRNPVNRAVSAFMHHIRDRTLPPNENILNVVDQFGIFSMGQYAKDLKEWMKYFSRDQFLVLIFEEDIVKNKEATLQRAFSFLGVDDSFSPNHTRQKYNRTEGDTYIRVHYRFPLLAKAMKKLIPGFSRLDFPKIEVKEAEKEELRSMYEPHNRELEQLLGRKLPW